MKKLLKKIGLLDSFTIELHINVQNLVDGLSKKTDKPFIAFVDFFSNNKKKYSGFVTSEKFELRKSKELFSFEPMAVALGSVKNIDKTTTINVDVYAERAYSILIGFSLVTIMFFSIGIAILISPTVDNNDLTKRLQYTFTLWSFASVLVGLPLWRLTWSVKKLKNYVEEDLILIEKKNRL